MSQQNCKHYRSRDALAPVEAPLSGILVTLMIYSMHTGCVAMFHLQCGMFHAGRELTGATDISAVPMRQAHPFPFLQACQGEVTNLDDSKHLSICNCRLKYVQTTKCSKNALQCHKNDAYPSLSRAEQRTVNLASRKNVSVRLVVLSAYISTGRDLESHQSCALMDTSTSNDCPTSAG